MLHKIRWNNTPGPVTFNFGEHPGKVLWVDTPGPITFHFDDSKGELGTKQPESENWSPKARALGVVLTNYCPISCRHCYNNSSPKGTEMVSARDLENFTEFLLSEGHPLAAVGLSGGEAMFHPKFFDIAGYFAAKGLCVSSNTSGAGLEISTLHKMQECGVDAIVFSSDSLHERHVRTNELLKLIIAATDILNTVVVKVSVASKSEGEGQVEKLCSILPEDVSIDVQPIIRIGRAAKSMPVSESDWTTGSHENNCAEELQALGVNFDGKVYACCSVGSFTKGLEIANISDPSTYEKIPKWYDENEALRTVCPSGFDAGSSNGRHKCEVCHENMKSPQQLSNAA